MGRPFITFFDEPTIYSIIRCAVCNVHITEIKHIIRNIETTEGSSIQCNNIQNYFQSESNTKSIGNLKYFDHLHGIFDPDTIFKTYNTGLSSEIYCVNCQQHWGWRYIKPITNNETFFILSNVITGQ